MSVKKTKSNSKLNQINCQDCLETAKSLNESAKYYNSNGEFKKCKKNYALKREFQIKAIIGGISVRLATDDISMFSVGPKKKALHLVRKSNNLYVKNEGLIANVISLLVGYIASLKQNQKPSYSRTGMIFDLTDQLAKYYHLNSVLTNIKNSTQYLRSGEFGGAIYEARYAKSYFKSLQVAETENLCLDKPDRVRLEEAISRVEAQIHYSNLTISSLKKLFSAIDKLPLTTAQILPDVHSVQSIARNADNKELATSELHEISKRILGES